MGALRRTPVLLLLAIGCAGGPTKPPLIRDIRPVPPLFTQTQAGVRAGLSVGIYNTGSVMVQGGAVSELKSWAAKVRLDIPAFLIRHPSRGLILFDTGLHPDMEKNPSKKMGFFKHLLVPFKAAEGQTLVAQLAKDRIAPEEVRWVVISHLHLDHAGAIEAFPNATVVLSKNEWERGRKDSDVDLSILEARVKIKLVDFGVEQPFGAFDAGHDLFGDGSLVLVDLAGHTVGSLGVWLNLDSGPVLLAGDASWVMDNHRDLALPIKGHIWSVDQYWRRLFMIKAMQQAFPHLVVFPGHDLAPLQLQPRPDVSLVPFPR